MSRTLAAKIFYGSPHHEAVNPVYKYIFFTNVLRILDERGMTKNELSERSGVSISFLSDLTTGKANPSLKVMEAIANALETSLPPLLTSTPWTPWPAARLLVACLLGTKGCRRYSPNTGPSRSKNGVRKQGRN